MSESNLTVASTFTPRLLNVLLQGGSECHETFQLCRVLTTWKRQWQLVALSSLHMGCSQMTPKDFLGPSSGRPIGRRNITIGEGYTTSPERSWAAKIRTVHGWVRDAHLGKGIQAIETSISATCLYPSLMVWCTWYWTRSVADRGCWRCAVRWRSAAVAADRTNRPRIGHGSVVWWTHVCWAPGERAPSVGQHLLQQSHCTQAYNVVRCMRTWALEERSVRSNWVTRGSLLRPLRARCLETLPLLLRTFARDFLALTAVRYLSMWTARVQQYVADFGWANQLPFAPPMHATRCPPFRAHSYQTAHRMAFKWASAYGDNQCTCRVSRSCDKSNKCRQVGLPCAQSAGQPPSVRKWRHSNPN